MTTLCRICRAIPDVADREDPGGLPPECEQLESLNYNVRRCPLCATYYDYFYDHDSGGGTSAGGTDEVLRRMTPVQTIERIRSILHDLPFEPRPTLENDLEALLQEHPDPEQTIEASIRCLDDAIAADDMLWPGNDAARLAAWSLGRHKAVEAIPTLVRALAQYPLCGYAARALATMGALPALVAALEADGITRYAATCALGHLARLDPALAPEIQRTLFARAAAVSPHTYGHEANSKELAAIVQAIGLTGYSEAALALLIDLLGRAYGWERDAAMQAIARMGKVVLPTLMPLLLSRDAHVVEAAIETLTAMGPRAKDALPALDACPMRPHLDWRIDRARSAITTPCRICRELPDRAEYKPLAFNSLQSLVGGESDLLKCPACDAYYEYSYEHYPGAPEYTCDPVTNEWLERRTDAEAIQWIQTALRDRPEVTPRLAGELDRLLLENQRYSS